MTSHHGANLNLMRSHHGVGVEHVRGTVVATTIGDAEASARKGAGIGDGIQYSPLITLTH